MNSGCRVAIVALAVGLLLFSLQSRVDAQSATHPSRLPIYDTGVLKPTASVPKLKVGDTAPDFTLPDINGNKVTLSQFRGKHNAVISFVPAAFTPVCSQQWPGYNIAEEIFQNTNTVLLGISVDNVPSLHAWTQQMGALWFTVLSDFWPHGAVSQKYGVLRDDGTSERALFVLDKNGIIRYIDIHDINKMPRLENLAKELEKLEK